MPSGRLPGRHQPHPRPLVSLLVKPQAHEIERRWRRSPFDCGGPERRASPRRLKLPPHGQHAEAAMRFAHPKFSQSQSSARVSGACKRAAKATTGPTGSELGFLGSFEKRSRGRLAAAVEFSSFAQSGLLAPTPCFAREEIRHETLFPGKRVVARRRHPSPALSRLHRPRAARSSGKDDRRFGQIVTVATPTGRALTRGDTRVFSIVRTSFFFYSHEWKRKKKRNKDNGRTRVSVRVDERSQIGSTLSSAAVVRFEPDALVVTAQLTPLLSGLYHF